MASLQDVVDQLKINNQGIDKTAKNLDAFIRGQAGNAGDELEARLKAQRTKPTTPESTFQRGQDVAMNMSLMPGFGILANASALIAPLVAGVTAFSAAMAGLRGWEVDAIRTIRNTLKSSVPVTISNGMVRVRNRVLGIFGLTAEGLLTRDAQGRFQRAEPLTTQIANQFSKLRTSALAMFGLGVDGKPIAVQGEDGLFKKNIVGRVTFQIGRLLNPLMRVSEGIAGFATGTGKRLFQFITGNILGPAGKVAGLIGRILKPIGFLFSAYEAVNAFMDEEGSVYDKSKAGFAAFIADFLGAPLDLLKNASVWILKNLLGLETNEDGTIKTGQGLAGDALATIQTFSFKDSIDSLIRGVFNLGEQAFDWFASIFKGEKSIGQIMSDLFTTWLGGVATIGDWVWNKTIKPVTEWFAEKLGFDITLPELDIMTMLTDTYNRIKTSFLSSMESLAIWFMTMPQKIGMALEEEWIMAIATLKTGFARFGNWISGLPDSIFIGAIEKLKEIVPDWASRRLGLDEAIASGAGREAERAQNFQAALERVDTSTARQLGQLNDRRRELETYEQQLLDARQYNTTNISSGGIVMDATTPTGDPLNGGSAYAFVGGR